MTVRVERIIEVPVEPERVWEFIVDPANRAKAISVVEDYELRDDEGMKTTWWVEIPLPVVDRSARVDTEDVTRRAPEYVEFVGRSKLLNVTGEHTIEAIDGGSRLTNQFVVDGRIPGIERFFRKNLDKELDNLERALREDLGIEAD